MNHQFGRAVCVTAAVLGGCAELHAAPTKVSCGTVLQKVVVSQSSMTTFETMSTTPVRIPGALHNVTIPSGSRCIKVTFSGGMSCQGNGGNATCYIRARAGSLDLNPGAISGPEMRSSYQWARRVTAGTHVVQIQIWRIAQNSGALIHVDDWTMDIEVLE